MSFLNLELLKVDTFVWMKWYSYKKSPQKYKKTFSRIIDAHPFSVEKGGKITLHLLFGWSLDKDEKSLDQSKQFSWQFGSIQTKAFPNPDQPPLEIFLINQYFCTKNKIIDNEKWKLLETLQYTIKEFNNGNVVCSTMHCPNGSRWGGDVKRVARILCIV